MHSPVLLIELPYHTDSTVIRSVVNKDHLEADIPCLKECCTPDQFIIKKRDCLFLILTWNYNRKFRHLILRLSIIRYIIA